MAVTITHVNTTPGPGNKVTAANWTAGHVITGGLQSVTVTIPSADILTLNTTPVELVPAPGAGKWLHPHRVAFAYSYGTAAYTGETLSVYYSGDANDFAGLTLGGLTGDRIAHRATTGGDSSFPVASAENVALVVRTGSAFTDGDGDLTVTVYYTVEDVPA